jgi:transposase
MEQHLKYGIGIDMSMKKFNACISVIDRVQKVTVKASSSFSNDVKGFTLFLAWVDKHDKLKLPKVFLAEATGVYHENLAWFLYSKHLPVSIILPNRAKKYLQSLGLKSKNDKIDAQGLSRMSCEQSLSKWNPLSENIYILRMITRQIESINEQATAIKNQLHALEHGMYRNRELEKMLKKHIALLESHKEKLQQKVESIINEDPILKERIGNIITIKGVGTQSAAVIVSELNGFALIQNQAQLVSYCGYDIVENQSGKHSGKTKISKQGNSHVRRALHFPSLNVVRYKVKPFANLYKRVFERTTIKMKGYTAVQKKLLITIYAIWKNNEIFDENKANIKNGTFRDGKLKPSFSPTLKKSPGPIKKLASDSSKAKQDGHSSKDRRMPSFSNDKFIKNI